MGGNNSVLVDISNCSKDFEFGACLESREHKKMRRIREEIRTEKVCQTLHLPVVQAMMCSSWFQSNILRVGIKNFTFISLFVFLKF